MSALSGVCFALLLAGPPAGASDWHDLLKLPLSPGAVALLVDHAQEPEVAERWKVALADGNPRVRAAAARVANVTGSATVVPALLAALATETDAEAEREQIEAVVMLTRGANDDLLATAKRLGPAATFAYAEALARTTGARVLDQLDALELPAADRRDVLEIATRSDRASLTRAASYALRKQDADDWDAVLAVARDAHTSIDAGMLIVSLSMASPAIRALTYWELVARVVDGGTATPLEEGLATAVGAAAESYGSPDAAAAFGFEMLKRARGETPLENDAWLALFRREAPLPAPYSLLVKPKIRALLVPNERVALNLRLTGDAKEPPELPDRKEDRGNTRPSSVHLVGALPRGLFSDLLVVSGCKPGSDRSMAGAEIVYDTVGRPRTVGFMRSALAPPCEQAARAALMSALDADTETAPGTPEVVLAVMDEDLIHCMDAEVPPAKPAPTERLGAGRIQEPKKIRNVAPKYPSSARDSYVQGVVVLEATVHPSGCIRDVRLLRSPDFSLSIASIQAVSGWRYTPTLLNGVPVPVIMTVTVNFKLN